MNNIIFCLDKNVIHLIKYVFNTFKKTNNIKKYVINFVIYDPNENLHEEIIKILNDISKDFIINYKYFTPTDELKKLLSKYEEQLIKQTTKERISNTVWLNLSNWSRFYINELYPNMKTGLYLDLDILICGDISDIFNIDLTDDIIAISPYINHIRKSRHIIDHINKDKRALKKTSLLKKLKININDLDTNNYNCGVIYYNFFNYKKKDILKSILIALYKIGDKGLFFQVSGTENIHNFIMHKYKTFSNNYNLITRYYDINLKENKIIHFKGRGLSNPKSIHFDEYVKWYKKIIS